MKGSKGDIVKHGGDLLTYKKEFRGELVDFSSNINPLGRPKGLDDFLIRAFKDLEVYPDIKYRKLKHSISEYFNCERENVLVGNGAVEIIDNFIILANRVAVCTPSFIEYEERATVHGKPLRRIPYKSDFSLDFGSLEALEENELLILGNPNNPTGLRIPKDDLMKVYELVVKRKAFLLLDEAFYEFCPEDYDSIEIFKKYSYERVGIIRAATKFFALPGIRLGYGCASQEKTIEISKVELPWSVNTLADAAAQYIFKDKEYIEKSKDYIDKERRFLLQELKKVREIQPYETHTNYILIKLLSWDEEIVFNHFLKLGIIIRKCSSFQGLENNHIRVAIKDREKNMLLLEGFKTLR